MPIDRETLRDWQLFEGLQGEGFVMPYTMEDFERDYIKKHLLKLTPEERRQALESLPPDERRQIVQSLPAEDILAALSAEQIEQIRGQLSAEHPAQARKSRRKR